MDSPKPTIGRQVHYILESGPNKGDHRPATIVRVWSGYNSIQLQVLTDSDAAGSSNDMIPNPAWRTSVMEDPEREKIGSWHWPERENP